MNAHASAERMAYLTKHGYNNHKPAPGSFKVYPYGNGNGPAPKKSAQQDSEGATLAEMNETVKELQAKVSGTTKGNKIAAMIQAIGECMDEEDE